MKVLVNIKGGSSSIDGELKDAGNMEQAKDILEGKDKTFILEKTPYGKALVPKSSVGYIVEKR